MWKGWLIEESLGNKNILPSLRIVIADQLNIQVLHKLVTYSEPSYNIRILYLVHYKSAIEENKEGDKLETWHLHTIEVDDNDIEKVAKKLEKLIKFGYYVHFTNYKKLLIIFKDRSFRIRLDKVLKEKEFGAVEFKATKKDLKIWQSAFDYGIKKGKVDPRYIIKVV